MQLKGPEPQPGDYWETEDGRLVLIVGVPKQGAEHYTALHGSRSEEIHWAELKGLAARPEG